MKGSVPFISPESLRVELTLPHHGKITGLGIRKGITLIVGGGYHGKSTLLSALERGVYNHIAGDGREYVIDLFCLIFQALEEICYDFDLGKPIWLSSNVSEFQRHSKTRFRKDSFIEEIPFDYLEIQVIEEDDFYDL